MRLLIATSNPGKSEEIKDILKNLPIELLTLSEVKIDFHPDENGTNYLENALIKARAYSQISQLPTLADDTGLEVDILNGRPGLRSARYSSMPNAKDADRRKLLLDQLSGKPHPWSAHFTCAVALALPDGRFFTAEGECSGEIVPVERGTNGFGYDPIFLFPELNKTMAELSLDEKNQISHRAKAVKAIIPKIIKIIQE